MATEPEMSIDELNAMSDENQSAVMLRNADRDEFDPNPTAEDMPSMVDVDAVALPESVVAEEAFHTAVLTGSEDPVAMQAKVTADIQETGTSEEAKAVRVALASSANALRQEMLFNLVNDSPNLSMQEKIEAVQAVNNFHASEVDTQLATMEELGTFAAEPTDPEAQEVAINMFELMQEQVQLNKDIMHESEMLGATLGGTNGAGEIITVFKDLMLSIAPFSSTRVINGIMEDALPDKAKWWMYVTPGEALSDMKDHLAALPNEDQLMFADTLLKAIEKNADLSNGNDFMKYMQIHHLFKETESTVLREGIDWDRWLENVTPLLDATIVWGVMKSSFRVIKGLKNSSPAATLLAGDRTLAMKLLAQGVNNDEVAKMLGTTGEELDTLLMAKPLGHSGDINTAQKAPVVPTKFSDEVAEVQRRADEVIATGKTNPLINYTPNELEKAISAERKVLMSYDGAAIHNSSLEVGIGGVNDSELIARGLWGLDGTYGFSTGTSAFDQAKLMFGDNAEFIIMRMVGDRMVKAKNLSAKGEYFIQHETRRSFDEMDTLMFGAEDQAVIYMGGARAGYMGDVSAIASREISNAHLSMHDRGRGLNTMITNIMSPFIALPAKSRIKVTDLITRGSDEGRTYSFADMIEAKLNPQEMIGMYSWQKANDALYALNDQRMHRYLTKEGLMHVTNSTHKFKELASPRKIDLNIKTALDADTGQVITFAKPAEIQKIYDDGGSIMRLKSVHWAEKNKTGTRNVIIRTTGTTRVDALPPSVLKYVKGYSARTYEDLYYIDKVSKAIVDGKPEVHSVAVHTAGGMTEAVQVAKKMNKNAGADSEVTFKARRSAESDTTEAAQDLYDIEVARGKIFFSGRGEHLEGASGGMSAILDPIDSMQRSVANTAKAVSHEPYVAAMKQRWVNTYGRLMAKNTGKYPRKFELDAGSNLAERTLVGQAKAAHDLIRIAEGSPDLAARHWKTAFLSFSERMDGEFSPRRWAARLLAKVGQKDITVRGKGLSFNLFLGANPMRQLPLQAQQFMFLSPLAPAYMASKFIPHSLGLHIGMIARAGKYGGVLDKSSKELLKLGAKAAGMSDAEYVHMLKSFKRSGMALVDSNIFAADALSHASGDIARNALRRGLTHVIHVPRTAFKLVKTLGFDFGEYMNVSGSWLIARKLHMKKTGKTWDKLNQLDNDEIGAGARQMALGMTEAGRFAYQKGYWSMMSQFVSIQHKVILAVLPKVAGGNKYFTGAEKAKIFAGQTFFFGAAAFGLAEGYEKVRDQLGYEPDPQVESFVTGGAVDGFLHTLYGDSDLTLAEDFAAGGGFYGTTKNIVVGLLSGEWDAGELFFGPSWQATGKIVKAVQGVYDTLSVPVLEDNSANLGLAVHEGMKMFGGYNNYAKSQYMMNIGHHVDRTGDPILKASYDEAVWQLVGFGSDAPNNMYEFKTGIPGQRNPEGYRDPKKGNHIIDTANTYYERLVAAVEYEITNPLGIGSGPEHNLDELQAARIKKAIFVESLILAGQSENDRYLILNVFRQKLADGIKDGSDKLVNNIIRAAIGGQYGDDTESMLISLRNASWLTDEQRDEVRTIYDYMNKDQ